MLAKLASLEASNRFLSQRVEPSSISHTENFAVSNLSIGTFSPEPYKEENYLFSYKDAIIKAVELGVNHIDTAANYRYTKSESETGEALSCLFAEGIKREELVLSTKGGFLPLSYPFPTNPYEWIKDEIIGKALAKESDIICDEHCLTPEFLAYSLERSLFRLGVGGVDIFYIHNPEFELGFIAADELYKKLDAVFEMLEEKKREGKIGAIGIASWNGFFYEPNHMEYLSLERIVEISRRYGSGVEFVQAPFNPAKPHGHIFANQSVGGEYMPLFYAAKKLGVSVITSSSLLRMNLFKAPLRDDFRTLTALPLASDLQRVLQFDRSNPLILSALTGTKDAAHANHNFELLKLPALTPRVYEKFFRL